MGPVPQPFPTPTTLPDPGDTTLQLEPGRERFKWEGVDMNREIRTGVDTCYGESGCAIYLRPNGYKCPLRPFR